MMGVGFVLTWRSSKIMIMGTEDGMGAVAPTLGGREETGMTFMIMVSVVDVDREPMHGFLRGKVMEMASWNYFPWIVASSKIDGNGSRIDLDNSSSSRYYSEVKGVRYHFVVVLMDPIISSHVGAF
jgi:hypothetical protein